MPQPRNASSVTMNPFLLLTMMYHIAWSPQEEDDDDYKAKVEVRSITFDIPKFPDISAHGPKAVGALKKLKDWIDDDVGEWLSAHEKEEFLHEDHGIPVQEIIPSMKGIKAEKQAEEKDQQQDDEESTVAQQDKKIPASLSKEEKKRKKINERKMKNFKQSQSTFFAEIKKAVKHNPDVLREVSAVPKCVDRGSRAIVAIRKYIMQDQNLVSVGQDSDKYFTDVAKSFLLKYPHGSVQPISCKAKDVNDTLGRALFELETHVNDFKLEFHNFPDKHWTKY